VAESEVPQYGWVARRLAARFESSMLEVYIHF
jgi:hypothetical protein